MEWLSHDTDPINVLNDSDAIRTLLVTTKSQNTLENSQLPPSILHSNLWNILKEVGLVEPLLDQSWSFSGTAKVRLALRAIQLGQPERPILSALTWQEFEEYVVTVFSFHDYLVHHRFRFTKTRRYEIDIIAVKNPLLFCIDCKHYGIRLGKNSSLRKAVEAQVARTQVLASIFASHQSALGCLNWQKAHFLPILVTLLHETLIFHENVPIIPASKLNSFLLNYHKQLDFLKVIQADSGRQLTLSND